MLVPTALPPIPDIEVYISVHARIHTDPESELYMGIWACRLGRDSIFKDIRAVINDLHAFIDINNHEGLQPGPVQYAPHDTIQWGCSLNSINIAPIIDGRRPLHPQPWTPNNIPCLIQQQSTTEFQCSSLLSLYIPRSERAKQITWAYHPDVSAIMEDVDTTLIAQIRKIMYPYAVADVLRPYPGQSMIQPLLDGTRMLSDTLRMNINPLMRHAPMNGQPWYNTRFFHQHNILLPRQESSTTNSEWVIGPLVVIDGICSLGISSGNTFHHVRGITVLGHHPGDLIMVVPYTAGMDHHTILDAIACTDAVRQSHHSMIAWNRRLIHDTTIHASIQRILDQATQLQADVDAWHAINPNLKEAP